MAKCLASWMTSLGVMTSSLGMLRRHLIGDDLLYLKLKLHFASWVLIEPTLGATFPNRELDFEYLEINGRGTAIYLTRHKTWIFNISSFSK